MAEQILRYTAQLAANDQLPNLGEVAAGIALTIPAFRFASKSEWRAKLNPYKNSLDWLSGVRIPGEDVDQFSKVRQSDLYHFAGIVVSSVSGIVRAFGRERKLGGNYENYSLNLGNARILYSKDTKSGKRTLAFNLTNEGGRHGTEFVYHIDGDIAEVMHTSWDISSRSLRFDRTSYGPINTDGISHQEHLDSFAPLTKGLQALAGQIQTANAGGIRGSFRRVKKSR